MALFYGIGRPFESKKDNFLNMYNEIVIAAVFYGILIINASYKISQKSKELAGWILIGCILVSLATTWLLLIPQVISDLKDFVLSFCKKTNDIEKPKVTENITLNRQKEGKTEELVKPARKKKNKELKIDDADSCTQIKC